jgi:RNA recognition motif-containing protein
MPRNYSTKKPLGFAFVRFLDENAARNCMREMDGKEMFGREVRITEAPNKRSPNPKERRPGGGTYRDNRGGGHMTPMTPSQSIPPTGNMN